MMEEKEGRDGREKEQRERERANGTADVINHCHREGGKEKEGSEEKIKT